jgi:regulatory protein
MSLSWPRRGGGNRDDRDGRRGSDGGPPDVASASGSDAASSEAVSDSGRGEPKRPQATAYGKALGLLTRREHSRRELARKLDQKGFEADEASAALEQLQRQSYQSDERFAQLLVRSRVSQGQGPRRILAELRTHGIVDDAARAALDEEGADWLALAQRVYRRRYGARPAPDLQESRRRAAFLLRRGFDAATVRAITHADDVDDSAEEFD